MNDRARPHSRAAIPPPSADGETARARDTLPIAETFTSIQGEGKWTGAPSFFIRVSGCNLRCAWCDTPYASWNPEGEERSLTSLVEEAGRSGVRDVVITGGEPMMFPQTAALTRLLRHARGSDVRITIETAGTIDHPVECDLMSISPKLRGSTPGPEHGPWQARHEARRINLPVLQAFIDRYPFRQLKFVIASEADLKETDELLAQLRGWSCDDVLLMPEGIKTPDETRRDLVVRACLVRGFRYCHRLHIELFGHARGT